MGRAQRLRVDQLSRSEEIIRQLTLLTLLAGSGERVIFSSNIIAQITLYFSLEGITDSEKVIFLRSDNGPCLALLNPNWRNWFHTPLPSIVVVVLRNTLY
jgi:hypothetical protein